MFIAEYIIDFNAARAARAAGYSNKNGIARIKGHQLLKESIVQEAINKEMEKRAKRTKITQDKVLYDLEHQRRAAIKNRQFTPAMRASELHGKHLAMFNDKLITENETIVHIQDHIEQAGIDLLDTLKQLAGESDVKEIELQEVKTKRKMKIKKRKKKRPKALLVEKVDDNGKRDKSNNNLLSSPR